ncbi:hypothetical protein [Streptomyces phaeoluteigriseus]|uniref:hypothetical protein n=1 Tax=Streptomyces phaeoluteigriseus TaxID=114686 RepID=UPI000D1AAF26|nr:hypothetical protein [Streptomyces phaeoluteigriseus]
MGVHGPVAARGELVGPTWVLPLKAGQDALAGIVELANIAAAAGADEVVLTVVPGRIARRTIRVASSLPAPGCPMT